MYLQSAFVSSPSAISFLPSNNKGCNKAYATKKRNFIVRCVNKIQSKSNILKNYNIVSRTRWEIAETLNSRMAMLGVICGSSIEYSTHKNFIDQVQTTYPYVVLMGLLIGYATIKTMNISIDEKRPFTMGIEMLNGRLAMMGVLAKIIYDSIAL